MVNPFLKRATEYYRDEEAFLAIVSPEPVNYFLAAEGIADRLYDRLVIIVGTPGSGKTTLARLFEYPTLSALLRHSNMDIYRPLLNALTECKAVIDGSPKVLGCRLALETDYRDFWEFDYPEELRFRLMTALIQSRAILGWLRNLISMQIDLNNVQIVPRPDAAAAIESIGGIQASSILKKARAVESALYKIVSSLVTPSITNLEEDSTSAYRPFDVIDYFKIMIDSDGEKRYTEIRPLVILDDAHTLHPSQFRHLKHWLTKRELRVSRWILTRLDILHPGEALITISEAGSEKTDLPGVTKTRDLIEIPLQSGVSDRGGRSLKRKSFRKMAKDMANRYLHKMPLFSQRELHSLSDLLTNELTMIPPGKYKELKESVDSARKKIGLNDSRYNELLNEVTCYLGEKVGTEDICLAMIKVLMYRYSKRTPQRVFFEMEEDPDPSRPLKVDVSVYDAARIHLLHQYNKPLYFGIDSLCDASSENAEQFLHLTATLVETAATQVIRSRPATLSAKMQNKLLRQKAEEIINDWNFPEYRFVKHLTCKMAERCLSVSVQPNAPLGAGANAFGIPQQEFDDLPKRHPSLARVLQFAIAYNALSIVPRYPCKKQEWCLFELGGMIILKYGLTLKRGGFIESTANELMKIVQEAMQ